MKFVIALIFLVASATATISWEHALPSNSDKSTPLVMKESTEKGRITNGDLARPKQFPYQVGLQLNLQQVHAWCGGTLISNQWILTAAHCTDSITSLDVYLGVIDRSTEGADTIHVDAKDVIVHEHWNPSTVQNDISLIRLPYPVDLNDYIQPAKLPNASMNYSGAKAIASGWGRTSDSEKYASDKLRWIEVPIIENSACRAFYPTSVHDTNICISTKGAKSTCNGDSGGPLVLSDGSNTLIGTTSFGIRLGCEKGWPGVFTRISLYLDWISANTGIDCN